MALKIGTRNVKDLKIGSRNVNIAYMGTRQVFLGPSAVNGFVEIDYDGTMTGDTHLVTGAFGEFVFTAPNGKTDFTVCMIGGGGGAPVAYRSTQKGGNSGSIFSGVLNFTENEKVNIILGKGGAAVVHLNNNKPAHYPGPAGEASVIKGNIAAGALAQPINISSNDPQIIFDWNGEEVTNCFGTFNNGLTNGEYNLVQGNPFGGHAGFADGTNGATYTLKGSRGSGCGAAWYSAYYAGASSGGGGDGFIRITY